jgi:hypothetical protein
VRAVSANPQQLHTDVLFKDSIRGSGAQIFRVDARAGSYKVQVLHPDGAVTDSTAESRGGHIDIEFAGSEWDVSGVVITSASPKPDVELAWWPETARAPRVEHSPAVSASPREPVQLKIKVTPAARISSVRLYYRPLNQLAEFKSVELPAGGTFTIPAEDVDGRFDLMYYFEILSTEKSGWIYPDPHGATPFFGVRVGGAPKPETAHMVPEPSLRVRTTSAKAKSRSR